MKEKSQTCEKTKKNYSCTPLLPIVTKKLIHTKMKPLTSGHQPKLRYLIAFSLNC